MNTQFVDQMLRVALKVDIIGAPSTAEELEALVPKILKIPHGEKIAEHLKGKISTMKASEANSNDDPEYGKKRTENQQKQQKFLLDFLLKKGLSKTDIDLLALLSLDSILANELGITTDKKFIKLYEEYCELNPPVIPVEEYKNKKLDPIINKQRKEREKEVQKIVKENEKAFKAGKPPKPAVFQKYVAPPPSRNYLY